MSRSRIDRRYVAVLALSGFAWLLIAILTIARIGQAQAGDLKLSTVQLRLTEGQPRSSLTISNNAARATLVHIRVQRWSQPNGAESFAPAPEMIVNPPIAEIQPGGKQLVRVGYAGAHGAAQEGSYRMFIEEVPMNDRERPQAIETYLNISLPVFVGAPTAAPPDVALTLVDSAAGPALQLANRGARHLRMVAYRFAASGAQIGPEIKKLQYALPGAQVALPLALDGDMRARADTLFVTTDHGELALPISRARDRR